MPIIDLREKCIICGEVTVSDNADDPEPLNVEIGKEHSKEHKRAIMLIKKYCSKHFIQELEKLGYTFDSEKNAYMPPKKKD